MQKRNLTADYEASTLGLGCMGMSEFYGPHDDETALSVLHEAAGLGIAFEVVPEN